jgi:aspartate/methionine/tyrosine aminotransferase
LAGIRFCLFILTGPLGFVDRDAGWRSWGWACRRRAASNYFIATNFRPLRFHGDDGAFCKHITEHAGVTAIPVSAFHDAPDAPSHYGRFAFCKKLEVLDKRTARL